MSSSVSPPANVALGLYLEFLDASPTVSHSSYDTSMNAHHPLELSPAYAMEFADTDKDQRTYALQP